MCATAPLFFVCRSLSKTGFIALSVLSVFFALCLMTSCLFDFEIAPVLVLAIKGS